MQITKKTITVRDLCQNYRDDNEGGVYGYDNGEHILVLRPKYQREFIYPDKKRDAVIDTIMNGFPLGIMYWSKVDDNTFECLDGQQRSISICQYVNSDFPVKFNGNDRFFHNLNEKEQEIILNYELEIRICEGSEEEKLRWFQRINVAGEVLTEQELLNATYTGSWLSDAKNFFSKRNCVAMQMADGYIKGNPIRQDILEKALSWIADRDNLESGQMYMAIHQHDEDANELWLYFQTVINWAKMLFPDTSKKLTAVQDWGVLYNKYHDKTYNSNALKSEVKTLLLDDDVTKDTGIIPYVLSGKTKHDEKLLSIRTFSEGQKIKAYEKQKGICPICGKHFEYEEMQGDHIVPWSKGGRTIDENLQMLCSTCNATKGNN